VRLSLRGLPAALRRGARVTHYRVDRDHSNSYAAWQKMGSPLAPSDKQRAELIAAARLSTVGDAQTLRGDTLSFALPRQGVSLLVIEPAR
jgi:xylan 1,4-beta-xylosidase